MHLQETIVVETSGQGLYEITRKATSFVHGSGIKYGLVTLFVQHTSASLVIQENADPDVQRDLNEFFTRTVPEGMDWLRHTCEGADDMPAHIKAALTATSISIPVSAGHLVLGTWQGIYLFEHRTSPHVRKIVLHLG